MNSSFFSYLKFFLLMVLLSSCAKADNLEVQEEEIVSENETTSELESVSNLSYEYEVNFHDLILHYKSDNILDEEEKTDEIEQVKAQMLDLFKQNSQLEFLKQKSTTSTVALERRASNDVSNAIKVMESFGFYSSKADFKLDLEKDPYLVTLNLYPNQQYAVGEVDIKYVQPSEVINVFYGKNQLVGFFRKKVKELYDFNFVQNLDGLKNDRASAGTITSYVDKLIQPLKEHGFPQARIVSSGFAVDKEKFLVNGTIYINHGMPTLMGNVQVQGNQKVSKEIIQKLAPWKNGDIWNEAKILEYSQALQQTGLFKRIEISFDKKTYQDYRKNVNRYKNYLKNKTKPNRPDVKSESNAVSDVARESSEELTEKSNVKSIDNTENAQITEMPAPIGLPVVVVVEESTSKTLSGTAFYSTDKGFGVEAGWEHRNFFGNAERFRLGLPISEDEALLSIDYKQSAFLLPKQSLIFRAEGGYEDTDAYERNFIDIGIGVSREINQNWFIENILHYDIVEPKDEPEEERYQMVRLVNTIAYDKRNSKENPSGGYFVKLVLSPLWGYDYEDFYSFATEIELTTYHSIAKNIVLVARLGLGIMPGSDFERIPRSERFFIGGNNTVRGFAYQELGIHDNDDDPIGGLSYSFINLEARYNLTGELAIIPFIDAGMVYKEIEPLWGQDLAFGVGIGGRYLTPVGPIRLDLAFPLTKPNKTTEKKWHDFQIYISIGQEF